MRETIVASQIFSIQSSDPNSSDAQNLLDELTAMNSLFGPVGGRGPFASFTLPGRSIILLVRDSTGVPFGCGAFVPAGHYVAEVTGPYCRLDRKEVNEAVLHRLETSAAQFGFIALNVEVNVWNRRMFAFYQAQGFLPITTSVEHRARPEASRLQKRLGQEARCFRSLLS